MIIDSLFQHVAPHDCLGCGLEGTVLCAACRPQLTTVPGRCYRCHRQTQAGRTCPACRRQSALYAVRAATSYDGVAKDLVWRLKFDGMVAAAAEMARCLVPLVPIAPNVLLVSLPTATARVRQRGYDQAALLMRELSRLTGLPYATCLRRLGQHHQVGAGRQQRLAQLKDAYRPVNTKLIADKHIILVDDVLTTGASLEAAAAALKSSGARRITGLVFAQA